MVFGLIVPRFEFPPELLPDDLVRDENIGNLQPGQIKSLGRRRTGDGNV